MKKIAVGITLLIVLIGCGQSSDNTVIENTTAESDTTATFATYDAEAFYKTTTYIASSNSGIAFSADGKNLLITNDATGVYNAYAMDIDTGSQTQLTHSDTAGNFAITYFPNDDRLLYSADGGGDELDHIWLREIDGTLKDLTPAANTKASFYGWNNDRNEFYIATNEQNPRQFDLYAYKVEDYSRRLIYQNDQAFGLGPLSRDGGWLALIKPRSSADSDVFIKNLSDNSEAKLITEHEGNISYSAYAFTPDSQALILATNEHGEFNQAWRYQLDNGALSAFETAAWDVSFVGFSTSGRYKIVGVNADAQTEISITDQSTGNALELPELPQGDISNLRFSADDKQIALLLSSDTSPRDVFVLSMGGEAKRLTNSLNPAIEQDNLVESEVIRYKSFDGLEIPSIQFKPKQASADNKAPALVLVHGGPGGQTRRGYNPMVQHLVNSGYAILGANNRGSSGYGKTFYHMDDRAHGESDLQDIVWGKKYLQSLDWVDGDKIGIIGGSYGGYMVAAALAFEPQEFAVGIDIFGVTNWVRTLKSIPPWWEAQKDALYDEMGDPATDEERHRRISPLFHAGNIIKPLLVIQGANDPRVLQVESDELVAAVKAKGTPVEYIIFPDEGHGFRSRENRITASNAYVAFLDKYLLRNGE